MKQWDGIEITKESFSSVPYARQKTCHEIIVPLCSGVTFSVNGKSISLHKNDFLVVSPCVFTQAEAFPPGGEYISLCFSRDFVEHAAPKPLPLFLYKTVPGEQVGNADFLREILSQGEAGENSPSRELILGSFVLKILSLAMYGMGFGENEAKALSKLEMLEYINANYCHCTEDEIAEHFSVSYGYFSRSFKAVANMSYIEYVTFLRINRAKKMLCETDKDVNTVSAELKFSSPSHFVNVFREKTGETPKKFKMRTQGTSKADSSRRG